LLSPACSSIGSRQPPASQQDMLGYRCANTRVRLLLRTGGADSTRLKAGGRSFLLLCTSGTEAPAPAAVARAPPLPGGPLPRPTASRAPCRWGPSWRFAGAVVPPPHPHPHPRTGASQQDVLGYRCANTRFRLLLSRTGGADSTRLKAGFACCCALVERKHLNLPPSHVRRPWWRGALPRPAVANAATRAPCRWAPRWRLTGAAGPCPIPPQERVRVVLS
jgi:hypothetical protein